MNIQTGFEFSQDASALAADGMQQDVDDRTLFGTPAPLAASTVSRDTKRAKQKCVDSKASFLDDLSRLSILSTMPMDITDKKVMHLDFSTSAEAFSQTNFGKPQSDTTPDLMHFSSFTEEEVNCSDHQCQSNSLTSVSSRSSMGLIPADLLSDCELLASVSKPDLSASVLPLTTPNINQTQNEMQKNRPDVSLSKSKERTGNSLDWSNNSKQDSKQDSKDMPLGNSHLIDTVKKRPPQVPVQEVASSSQHILQGAVSLFTGCLLENVEETNELDQSISNFELEADFLQQLDANFVDLDILERSSTDEGRFSDDENFDAEPMFALPDRKINIVGENGHHVSLVSKRDSCQAGSNIDSIYFREQEQTHEADNSEINKQEGRHSSCHTSEKDMNDLQHLRNSQNGIRLDDQYFQKTAVTFAGDGENIETTNFQFSFTLPSQQQGSVESGLLKPKQRTSLISGNCKEMHKDEDGSRELTEYRSRSIEQRRDDGDSKHNFIHLSANFEEKQKLNENKDKNNLQHLESDGILKGPGDGDVEGDSNSGYDSDDSQGINSDQKTFANTFPLTQMPQMPYFNEETGLHSAFFMPTASLTVVHDAESPQALEGSTFRVEDILDSHKDLRANSGPSVANVDCNQELPFECHQAAMQSSLGSFGLSPPEMKNDSLGTVVNNGVRSTHTKTVSSIDPTPGANKGRSFVGSFKKPQLPSKKNKDNTFNQWASFYSGIETFPSVSNITDQWKELSFTSAKTGSMGSYLDLENELRELGISIGEEVFQTQESAEARLAAAEKLFEEENKFSEHHQLAVAAEGMSWGTDDSCLSGYLGGEDKPEHLELSIGTYMATRTETLGTLGDSNVARPEFGMPLQSPPHRSVPVRLISFSSSELSVSHDSHSDGEGENTLISETSTQIPNYLSPPSNMPIPSSERTDEDYLKQEISAFLLDLTQQDSSDVSMEDALSMSTVLNFVKKHDFSKSSDFAKAILKLSHAQNKSSKGERLVAIAEKKEEDSGENLQSSSKFTLSNETNKTSGNSPELAVGSGVLPQKSNRQVSSSASRSIALSPSNQNTSTKGSRLPVRTGFNLNTSTDKKCESSLSRQNLENRPFKNQSTLRVSGSQIQAQKSASKPVTQDRWQLDKESLSKENTIKDKECSSVMKSKQTVETPKDQQICPPVMKPNNDLINMSNKMVTQDPYIKFDTEAKNVKCAIISQLHIEENESLMPKHQQTKAYQSNKISASDKNKSLKHISDITGPPETRVDTKKLNDENVCSGKSATFKKPKPVQNHGGNKRQEKESKLLTSQEFMSTKQYPVFSYAMDNPPVKDTSTSMVQTNSQTSSQSNRYEANYTDNTEYHELNEDLQQTTVLGGEGCENSALGSFWGKSPMYQSTPAFIKMTPSTMMVSKLDERELDTPSTKMKTPKVQRPFIDIQRTVIFPEYCCLGVSQKTSFLIVNRSSYGLTCRFRVLHLLLNGKLIKQDQQSPFEMKPKMSIGAGETALNTVLFVPKWPGEHIAPVEVYTQSLSPSLEPTTTILQLQAIAEIPNVEISPSVDVLEFGELTWGACLVKSIKLRNLKRSSLPIRLSIWTANSLWHCFTFDNSIHASDLSIISLSSRPESVGRNIQTVILPGCESESDAKVVEIRLYCQPPVKDLNRALAERPAEQMEARLEVEVDTPVQYLPALASLTMKATIGVPHLLIPTNHMSLRFKTEPNKNIQESITLHNSGNISMNIALSVTTYPGCFQISPNHTIIKPASRAEVTVIFSPLESGVYKYQSLLLLDIENSNQSYEIPLEAQVAQPAPPKRSTPPSIMSSKSFLSFTGVALNQTKTHSLRLYNKDNNRAENVQLEMKGNVECFKLVAANGELQQKIGVLIQPKEKVTLTVIFCPTAVRGYSGKLVIKMQESYSTKYSIPLVGYGGRSVLSLSGACKTRSGQHWLELGPLTLGQNVMQDIVVTNSGVRAAFFQTIAFSDITCTKPLQSGRIAIEPNNLILTPGSSTKVVVAISPSKHELELVKERKEVVAFIRFQHGDEVMRQKYQRALARDGDHFHLNNFCQLFTNESLDSVVQEGCTIPDSPDDAEAFRDHLNTQTIALLGEPHPEREMSSISQLQKPLQTSSNFAMHGVSFKQYDPSGQFLIPSKPEHLEPDWSVKPDHLSLTVGETVHQMLQITNFLKMPLRFELSWAPNSVVPEPPKGEIKPKSSTSIEVWLHLAWQKRVLDLPWIGDLVITCNGQNKIVRVHIKSAPQPSLLAITSPKNSPKNTSGDSTTTVRTLQLASTNIHFPKARVDEQYESVLELTNTSTVPLKWKFSSFAPAYVKGADENNTVQRVSYNVFQIIPSSGELLAQESIKVLIKFCPKTKGNYNQHWEVEHQSLNTKSVPATSTTKIFISAEVIVKENLHEIQKKYDPVLGAKEKTVIRTPLQEKQPNTLPSSNNLPHAVLQDLLLLNPEVHFIDTKLGQSTQVKIEFKNSFDQNVQLEVEAPRLPFRAKHLSFGISKRRFLKYPIEFRPTLTGLFEDAVVFRAPQLNKTFTVHLTGKGV